MKKERTDRRPAGDPDLGRSLAVLRVSRGWYQSDVSLASGIPPSAVCEYENAQRTPELRNLQRLVTGMGYQLSAIEETSAFLAGLRARHGIPTERNREQAPLLFERLERYTLATQKALVREAREFQSWALVELLALESAREAAEDATRALQLAELALEIALQAPGDSPWLAKLRSFAWQHVGNARRVAGNLPAADTAFETAERLWAAGQHDPTKLLDPVLLPALKASLRRAQRRFPEAAELLDQALALHPDDNLKATILVNKGNILEAMGEIDAAILALQEAAPFVLTSGDRKLLLCLRHNLVDYLSKAERHDEAEALLPEVAQLAREVGGELDRVRLRWTQARVLAGRGETDKGIEALRRVRAELVSHDLPYDVALISLELATIYAGLGQFEEVKSVARHLVPVFQLGDVHREALGALMLFRGAAEREIMTVELAQRVLRFLRRAQHDPQLRFQ
jgi:tetratricopeptide (TPR) repeat protein